MRIQALLVFLVGRILQAVLFLDNLYPVKMFHHVPVVFYKPILSLFMLLFVERFVREFLCLPFLREKILKVSVEGYLRSKNHSLAMILKHLILIATALVIVKVCAQLFCT